MKRYIQYCLIITFYLGVISLAWAQHDPKYYGMNVVFGNLHAHSSLSDDVNDPNNEMTPDKAFKYADDHGLDFLAITDHHKAIDSNHRLALIQQEYTEQLYNVAMTYNTDHEGSFIAIPGIEWGNTATGNHVNVFGLETIPPDSIKDKDYNKLYGFAKTQNALVQFNHPKSWSYKTNRDKTVGNFGRSLYEDDIDFRNKVDDVVKTISIICSVKGGHIGGAFKHATDKTHRDMQWENLYKEHLNLGFHISPAANQDTHWKNWGTVTAARTAVWTKKKTYESFMDAVNKNRIYATEDDEMVVVFQVEHKTKRFWMGETVALENNTELVDLIVKVWQAKGTDNDNADEGPYTITINYDPDGIGGQEAYSVATYEHVPSFKFQRIPMDVQKGSYVYIQVSEENGKDNLTGEGDDENNNDTGADGKDGKRDDPNDSAWTTPIWFN